ncbi:MAG: hypothetical protein ACKVQQ_09055 [Burkholderiales bacterium]
MVFFEAVKRGLYAAVFTQVEAEVAAAVMDASIAYETMTFSTQNHRQAVEGLDEKRRPQFTRK